MGYILEGGYHLKQLINDILDLSRIEADKIEYDFEPVDVYEGVDGCIRQLRQVAQERQITLYNGLDEDEEILIWADGLRFRQIISTSCPTPSNITGTTDRYM